MKTIFLLAGISFLTLASCGKSAPKDVLDEKDTLTVDEMEQELIKLESESQKVNNKLDSINNILNE